MTFTISALLILFATLALLARPLFKTRNTLSYERQAQNIHFAKERLQELEDQLKNASISATDYEALKLEIESNLANDINLATQTPLEQTVTPQRSNKLLISSLCVILPLLAGGVYWATGTPSALSSKPGAQTTAAKGPSADDVNKMLVEIEQRLKKNPSDAKGWAILSRTYLALGRFSEARTGFLKLIELEGESAELLTSLADASSLMAGGDMSGEPAKYIEQALTLDPDNAQALWLGGLAAAQQSQTEKARRYWNKLLPLLANSPKQQQELKAIIQEMDDASIASTAEGTTTPNAIDKDAQTNSSDIVDAQLNLNVSIADTMLENVNADDLVFIFARAKNGPPAPLAVKRLTVADLPAKVNLSDSDAMLPQFKMSLFEELVVSARVSKSGNPVAQTGDIQSTLLETKNSAKGELELEINNVVK